MSDNNHLLAGGHYDPDAQPESDNLELEWDLEEGEDQEDGGVGGGGEEGHHLLPQSADPENGNKVVLDWLLDLHWPTGAAEGFEDEP